MGQYVCSDFTLRCRSSIRSWVNMGIPPFLFRKVTDGTDVSPASLELFSKPAVALVGVAGGACDPSSEVLRIYKIT